MCNTEEASLQLYTTGRRRLRRKLLARLSDYPACSGRLDPRLADSKGGRHTIVDGRDAPDALLDIISPAVQRLCSRSATHSANRFRIDDCWSAVDL